MGKPAGELHADHPVADRVGRNVVGHLGHDPRELATGCKRQLGFELLEVLYDQRVGKVNARSVDGNAQLPAGQGP